MWSYCEFDIVGDDDDEVVIAFVLCEIFQEPSTKIFVIESCVNQGMQR
jgi:hypothetical protein